MESWLAKVGESAVTLVGCLICLPIMLPPWLAGLSIPLLRHSFTFKFVSDAFILVRRASGKIFGQKGEVPNRLIISSVQKSLLSFIFFIPVTLSFNFYNELLFAKLNFLL